MILLFLFYSDLPRILKSSIYSTSVSCKKRSMITSTSFWKIDVHY